MFFVFDSGLYTWEDQHFCFLVEFRKYRDTDNIKDINIRRISFVFSCDVSLLDIQKFLQMSNFFVIFTDIIVCCCIKI